MPNTHQCFYHIYYYPSHLLLIINSNSNSNNMLRNSLISRGAYLNREAHFPIRRTKSHYLFKMPVRKRDPRSNKTPLEWLSNKDNRMGEDWYLKSRRRHQYVGWPYISWKYDPVRHHKTQTSRTLSAKMNGSGNTGYPLWDHYEEAGLDYELPNDAPLSAAQSFLTIHVGSTWPNEDVAAFCESIDKQFSSKLENISENPDALRQWRDETPEGNIVPPGFVEHVILLARDVLRNNAKKDYRRLLHSNGVLRTKEMQRYYALPILRSGPAMPEKLAQAPGKEDPGDFLWRSMEAFDKTHPLLRQQYNNPKRAGYYDA